MSFGVGQSMSKSVQDNLKLKGKRKTIFDRKVTTSQITQYDFDDKQASPEQLESIKTRLKQQQKRLLLRRLFYTFFGIFFMWMLWMIFK